MISIAKRKESIEGSIAAMTYHSNLCIRKTPILKYGRARVGGAALGTMTKIQGTPCWGKGRFQNAKSAWAVYLRHPLASYKASSSEVESLKYRPTNIANSSGGKQYYHFHSQSTGWPGQ